MRFSTLKYIYLRTPIFVRLLFAVPIAMVLFGFVIHYIEPKTFPTVFDGIWWTLITASTVGYGDYIPTSLAGRIAASFLILSGGGLLAFYITSISAAAIKHEHNLGKGIVAFKGRDHFIFVGWNERSKEIFQLTKKADPNREIVIIDRTLEQIALDQYPVHFIKGDASTDQALELASVKTAEAVIITADPGILPRQADHATILATIAIRGNHPDVRIITELLTDQQAKNAKRAGASALIRTDQCISTLLHQELYHPTTMLPFQHFIKLLQNQKFSKAGLPKAMENQPFIVLLTAWNKEGKLVIAIIRDDAYLFNPQADFICKHSDEILFFENLT